VRTRKEFSIRFNRKVAYSISYADSQGSLLFTFDQHGRRREITLHRYPVQDGKMVAPDTLETKIRIDRALERVTHYLEAKRFSVSSAERSAVA